MKKKYIVWILSIGMMMTVVTPSMSYAGITDIAKVQNTATENTTTQSAIQTETTQTAIKLEKVNLSLDGAYKKLEGSKTMEMIKLQKQSDESVAKGYSEISSSYSKMEKSNAIIAGYDSSNKLVAQERRDFANLMLESNNQARVNAMKQQTFQKYYTIRNTETQVQIAKESLQLKKNFLETTKRKYQVGIASKIEVDTAEKDVKNAESQFEATENGLKQLKLNFNSYLGYDIAQEVVLTDQIQEIELPKTSLTDAIALALKNRNEIKEAAYNVKIAQLNFNSYKAYPSSSSKYISAKTQILNAEIANQNKPTDIELDVRTKYDSMMDAYNSVQTAKRILKSAEDTLNTTTRKYKLGLVTISDVQQAQLALNNATLSQENNLLTYKLAVETYNLSMGVGTTAANL
ncbi:MAG: TolC family protein [Aminipila sp.]